MVDIKKVDDELYKIIHIEKDTDKIWEEINFCNK